MLPPELLHSFQGELQKLAYEDVNIHSSESRNRRRRFGRIHKMLKQKGADVGAGMKRIVVSKKHLTEKDIHGLQFKPVTIAVPEAGQTALRSFRHPMSNHHIHEHGDSWVVHEDSHPSTTMLWEKSRLHREGKLSKFSKPHEVDAKKPKKKPGAPEKAPSRLALAADTVKGMPHLIGEGVPGMYHYLRGRVTGSAGMKQRVSKALDPAVIKRMARWRPSKSAQPHHSAPQSGVTGSHD